MFDRQNLSSESNVVPLDDRLRVIPLNTIPLSCDTRLLGTEVRIGWFGTESLPQTLLPELGRLLQLVYLLSGSAFSPLDRSSL